MFPPVPTIYLNIKRKTCDPYSVAHYDSQIRLMEVEPYLTWVPENLRAQTIDPTTLPDRPHVRRRILLLSSTYLTGGAEMFAVNVARILAPYHDVFLWSQRPGPYVITGDLPVHEGDPVELAKSLDVDLVIYNNGAGFWTSDRFRAELPRAKTVMNLHGLVQWTVNQFKGYEGHIRHVDAFWAFSRVCGAMKYFGFQSPAYELHCPVPDERFPFRERRWKAPYNIGYVGRVSVEKNLVNLVLLWHRIWTSLGDRVRFHFVGGLDPMNKDPEYLAWLGPVVSKAKGLPEWKAMMDAGVLSDYGQSPPEKVAEVVRRLHVLTLTSDFEGEPVVFTEAMASGCICSFRDVGEVGEQLRGHGLLTTARTRKMDTQELDEMAASIVDLLHHPKRCQERARAGRARYEQRHAPEAWAANFNRMIEDVLR